MSGHNHQLTSGFENLTSANSTSSIYSAISQSLDSLIKPKPSFSTSEQDLTRPSGSEKPLNISNISSNILEISPFERNLTYKCSSCSKRTNCLEKMETHIKLEHPNRIIVLDSDNPGSKPDNAGYKTMTRDQVIDMITLNANSSNKGGFICYFCEDVVGNIEDIKNHFTVEHDASEAFKVKRVKVIFVNVYPKAQLISKCPFGVKTSSEKPTKFFLGFLP
jgi:hypothetical protein